jgi:L-threonylcarbamoyladenylate synthase
MSSQPSLHDPQKVINSLSGKIDLLIDGGICACGIPSTIVDCSTITPNVIREGEISKDLIADALEDNNLDSILRDA